MTPASAYRQLSPPGSTQRALTERIDGAQTFETVCNLKPFHGTDDLADKVHEQSRNRPTDKNRRKVAGLVADCASVDAMLTDVIAGAALVYENGDDARTVWQTQFENGHGNPYELGNLVASLYLVAIAVAHTEVDLRAADSTAAEELARMLEAPFVDTIVRRSLLPQAPLPEVIPPSTRPGGLDERALTDRRKRIQEKVGLLKAGGLITAYGSVLSRDNVIRIANYAGLHLQRAFDLQKWGSDTSLPETSLKHVKGGVARLMPHNIEHPSDLDRFDPEQRTAAIAAMHLQTSSFIGLEQTVIDCVCHLWMQHAARPEDTVTISANDILELRGLKKPPGGGYRKSDKKRVMNALSHVASTWLYLPNQPVKLPGGRVKTLDVETKVIEVVERWGTLFSHYYFEADYVVLRPGLHFGRAMLTPGMKQIGLLDVKALRFDFVKQAWERRLSRYLGFLWRIKLHKRDQFVAVLAVRTILGELTGGLDTRNAAKQRIRLERTLDRLQADGIIERWEYTDTAADNKEWANTNVRIWAPKWMREDWERSTNVVLIAPRRLHLQPVRVRTVQKRLASRVKELGLSQAAAGEQIGISRKQLGNILAGASKNMRKSTATKIEAWLSSC